MPHRSSQLHLVLALLLLLAAGSSASALTLQFDYSYDSNNFFSGVNIGRRAYLDSVAQVFNSHLYDSLSAINPNGQNTWAEIFDNPSTGDRVTLNNPTVAANTVVIYVGAQVLDSGILGIGGPGGYTASGTTQAWLDTVAARGQTGALLSTPTDFGPWGGAVTFNSSANWYFDSNPATIESFSGKSDFYSVAVHEVGHLLGLGTAPSWDTYVNSANGTFTGKYSVSAYGKVVPLNDDDAHWAENTKSTLPFSSTMQEASMDPSILEGTRKYFTNLDYAGLQDVGWQVTGVPEPGAGSLLMLVGVCALGVARPRSRGLSRRSR